ncbi:MAG: hypothetical protein NC923_07800 [Candidatus Omnitrophica bacterium]|nr:hypothetical protein [Candidatus Omnitrophota bacterium]
MYEYYDKRTYELKGHNPQDYYEALNKIREWNYHDDSKIALGVFYKKEAATFDERISSSRQEIIDIVPHIERISVNTI